MVITVLSDTHNRHQYVDISAFKSTDLLIHAGDFTSNGSLRQASDFLTWFSSIDVPNRILIAGNHDKCADTLEFFTLLKQFPNITYLMNSSTTINGLSIFGSPFSNEFGNWSFMANDLELDDIWSEIPINTDIVITHGPAYGLADLVDNDYEPGRDKHVGSKTLRARLYTLPNLKLSISGHIHSGYGTHISTFTTVSAPICDELYVPFNKPISIHIEDKCQPN